MLRTLAAVAVLLAAGGYAWYTLKEIIMTTKDEILAELADTKTVAEETRKDTERLASGFTVVSGQLKDVQAKLDAAIANGDLSAVSAAVADLKVSIQDTDDLVESASPEATPQPAQPQTPAGGNQGDAPVSDQPTV